LFCAHLLWHASSLLLPLPSLPVAGTYHAGWLFPFTGLLAARSFRRTAHCLYTLFCLVTGSSTALLPGDAHTGEKEGILWDQPRTRLSTSTGKNLDMPGSLRITWIFRRQGRIASPQAITRTRVSIHRLNPAPLILITYIVSYSVAPLPWRERNDAHYARALAWRLLQSGLPFASLLCHRTTGLWARGLCGAPHMAAIYANTGTQRNCWPASGGPQLRRARHFDAPCCAASVRYHGSRFCRRASGIRSFYSLRFITGSIFFSSATICARLARPVAERRVKKAHTLFRQNALRAKRRSNRTAPSPCSGSAHALR